MGTKGDHELGPLSTYPNSTQQRLTTELHLPVLPRHIDGFQLAASEAKDPAGPAPHEHLPVEPGGLRPSPPCSLEDDWMGISQNYCMLAIYNI